MMVRAYCVGVGERRRGARIAQQTKENNMSTSMNTLKLKAGDNAKKIASHALENAITRLQARLLALGPVPAERFRKILDKTKRQITSQREDSGDELKRIYPVQVAANFKTLQPILNPVVNSENADDFLSLDDGTAFLTKLGNVLKNEIETLLGSELPVIRALSEDDMKKNVYLGKDMTPVKK